MTTTSPLITLNNGVEMPALGLGVFLAPPAQTADAVETAIACGYRLVDTAAAYNNERQVGEGIRRSGIARSEIFVTTKLWVADYGDESARSAFEASRRACSSCVDDCRRPARGRAARARRAFRASPSRRALAGRDGESSARRRGRIVEPRERRSRLEPMIRRARAQLRVIERAPRDGGGARAGGAARREVVR